MNILQITNTACSDTNQATGVNRVVILVLPLRGNY